ncbi:MAG: hypothetical protein ACXWRE_11995 [Pseudobdellovibrionaceae bacterium]
MLKILFMMLISGISHASDVALGVYELDTQAGWAAGFELKDKHKVVITPAFGTEEEDYDVSGKSLTKKPDVNGTWKETDEGIEVSYGKVVDYFKYTPNECEYWPESPCLIHLKSKDSKGEKSLLKYKQAWVNRKVKLKPAKALEEKRLLNCQSQCKEMASKKQLRKGISESDCASTLCKYNP